MVVVVVVVVVGWKAQMALHRGEALVWSSLKSRVFPSRHL